MIAATPALAQTPAEADLAALVRAQAAEIAALKARLDRPKAASAPAPSAVVAGSGVSAPVQSAQAGPLRTLPFAPQLAPPGPADRDMTQSIAARDNPSGLTTEWGAGLPVFHSADGIYSFKPRGRILTDVSSSFGSKYGGRNITTTGMRALRLGLEGGVGTHFLYQFETDFSENQVDIVTAFVGWRDRIRPGLDYDIRAGHLFHDRGFEGSTGSDSTPLLERTTVATAIIPQRGFYGLGLMSRVSGRPGMPRSRSRETGSTGCRRSATAASPWPGRIGTRSSPTLGRSISAPGASTNRCRRSPARSRAAR